MPAFPDHFLWGAATSAYQIEGSPLADGAGPSNWHRFSHTPGMIAAGDDGDVACDHYRRWQSDVALMRELGLQAYRFSVSWSRVLPAGRGAINQKGLDFYRHLTDALLEAGIQPMITLYHWDLPAALDDLGGWVNRDVARWFADYAAVLFRALGDRVPLWATLNEPWVVTEAGYLTGQHAPGHRSRYEAALAAHNLMRAHGAAVRVYRTMARKQIGLVVNLEPKYPASGSEQDLAAVERAEAYMNRQYLDPVVFGEYPERLVKMYGAAWPEIDPADFQDIRQPIDFLGINYYTRGVTAHDPDPLSLEGARRVRQPRAVHMTTEWEVFPQGLTDVLVWVTERYGKMPLYITENGAAFYDPPFAANGTIEDPLRIDYLRQHFRAAAEAMGRGVDLRGYFVWSLFDNFEWAHGYSKRFGIVHVDYATQQRTPKASARFYSEVIRTRGADL